MSDTTRFAATAALLGDPARANILTALMDGRALTAKELAYAAHVSPQTTSGHLGKLTDAGLLALQKQGRHHYYRLASPLVGQMLESVMAVAGPAPQCRSTWRGGEALRTARTCYDHLAGRLGVALADAFEQHQMITPADSGWLLTGAGERRLGAFGLDVGALHGGRRPLLRPCLDWTERRPHMAGSLGQALSGRLLDLGWVRRAAASRAIVITPLGEQQLLAEFAIKV
jgi:DNA-binding transcriptional ArsR family regulator